MDITSITQAYTDQIAAQNTTASKLNKTLETTDYAKANDDELLDACKQFEAYFMEMIFKEMQYFSSIFTNNFKIIFTIFKIKY